MAERRGQARRPGSSIAPGPLISEGVASHEDCGLASFGLHVVGFKDILKSFLKSCNRGKSDVSPVKPPPPLCKMAEPTSPLVMPPVEIEPPPGDPPPSEPPPPYTTGPHRHRSRRVRGTPARVSSDSVVGCEVPTRTHPSQRLRLGHGHPGPDASDDDAATENTPLLPTPLLRRRERTASHSSTVRSNISGSPSFAQTLISAFQPGLDSDIDSDVVAPAQDERRHLFRRREISESSAEGLDQDVEHLGPEVRIKRYFRPMGRRAYYSAVFHLLVVNFPFALLAWVYLFVFTLVGRVVAYPSSIH